ncbi:MAG TPA: alcohol dehydrogenase catalytic domain-containing protein [Bryobacteraceae bacterium]|nr:alcohol dehydrogenase catalytic domain-containing protein [Bryobacteraceae bacterium]
MLVAQLIAPRVFRLEEKDLPPPGPGEVAVRVEAVGVCGSDLHAYGEGAVGDTPCEYPMVLGHEPAGTVIETGEGVTGWAPGDRVALEPALYCYHCEYCRAGRYNICANLRFLSTPGDPGFFRDRVNLPAANLLALPPSVSLDAGSLVEPLAVALHSVRLAGVARGETAAVFGAGPIGLLTVACLKIAGAGRIWAFDPVPHRREIAARMGADSALDPKDAESAMAADTSGHGVACAFDCAARDDTTNRAIRAARRGGRVILTGIHSNPVVPFETSPMRRKELVFYNVRRSNDEPAAALQLLSEHVDLIAPLITHTRPLDEIADAFSISETYSDGVGKMLVRPI